MLVPLPHGYNPTIESTVPFHINRRHHNVGKHKPIIKTATCDYINDASKFGQFLAAWKCYICNIGSRDLPDMSALALRCCTPCTYQANHSCPYYIYKIIIT